MDHIPHFWSPMIQSRKMSGEKVNTMKCLGAEILRTPTEAPVRLHGRPWGHVFFFWFQSMAIYDGWGK